MPITHASSTFLFLRHSLPPRTAIVTVKAQCSNSYKSHSPQLASVVVTHQSKSKHQQIPTALSPSPSFLFFSFFFKRGNPPNSTPTSKRRPKRLHPSSSQSSTPARDPRRTQQRPSPCRASLSASNSHASGDEPAAAAQLCLESRPGEVCQAKKRRALELARIVHHLTFSPPPPLRHASDSLRVSLSACAHLSLALLLPARL